jgi:4-aminobutyrate aminotransferase/(S)-3-amino-2-methylpropionate transaminase
LSDESNPKIYSTPPGPKSRKLARLNEKYVPKAVYQYTPIFASGTEGSIITDVDGNEYIDFVSGISSLNIGHRNPEIIKIIKQQLDNFLHLCYHVTPYELYFNLAQKLVESSPGTFDKKVFLVTSGTEAVENAVKIARAFTGRPNLLAFEYAFHGRTHTAVTLTGSAYPYRVNIGPLDPAVLRTPCGYCYRCSFGLQYPDCGIRCIEYIRESFNIHMSPEEIAAIIFEPIHGEGGMIVPPKEFVKGLKEISEENNILLIADEIQSGLGRTGKMFAVEHYGITPDMITVAKSLGGGLPLGAVIGRTNIMDFLHIGGLGGTFGGNPISCAAGLKTIELIEKNLANVNKLENIAMNRLEEMYDKYELIGDIRGKGLMIGVELVKDRKTKQPAKEEQYQISKECYENGLIVVCAGPYKNIIRFLPPININEKLLNKGIDIFENALKKIIKN